MPVRAVTTRFMYKGLCTIPDVLSYRTPVILPEDEVEGKWSFYSGVKSCHIKMQHPPGKLVQHPGELQPGVRFFSTSTYLTVGLLMEDVSTTDTLLLYY